MKITEKNRKLRATLRVVVDPTEQEAQYRVPRPSPRRIEQAACALQELGFNVVGRSRFGLEVEGTPELFREALHVPLEKSEHGFASPVTEPVSSLKNLVDYLEILPRPKYYAVQSKELAHKS